MGEQVQLRQDLGNLNVSLVFLLLIILAVLLSLWSALIQRCQLQLALKGEDSNQVPSVYPIRQAGSAITVGSLGFFLCLALGTRAEAQTQGDPAAARSAQVNVTASLLVLLAAILRLVDLQTVERERQSALLEETTFPE